jgi:two-component system, sensor histidine kinase and response regulator
MKPINMAQLLGKISPFIQKEAIGTPDISSYMEEINRDKDNLGHEVVADIRGQLNPLLKKLETSIIISSVKSLAERLISLGQEHQSEPLTSEGRELMGYAECYDIVNIKLKLRQIEKILLEDNSNEE